MKSIYTIIAIGLSTAMAMAQSYNDYVGAGHNVGFTITASSSEPDAGPEKTMDASGMDSRYFAAGRFLNQATLGATKADIDEMFDQYNNDYEAWIDGQFAQSPDYLRPQLDSIWNWLYTSRIANGQEASDIFGPYALHFNYTWWQHFMTSPDKLRHKIAYALSQTLVVSTNSDISDWAEAQAYYYDLLIEHSFGNYKDLLMDVTYSIPMGYYLSHYNNPREVPGENVHPDENYAREIMQLFTIGLYELNNDGTRKLDASGDFIPTYGQGDIKELAQVFTGLGPGDIYDGLSWPDDPFFGLDLWAVPKDSAMFMYDQFHDQSTKELVGGVTLPAGQSGNTDIQMAVNNLFEHPNVGPFIGRQLIQRLVKSNPSPAYIDRVASAFNNNGSGVRGDMKAVVKAVLMDEEAREGSYMLEIEAGKLREPLLRAMNFAKGVGLYNPDNRFWNNGYNDLNNSGQHVLASPTVFNFYAPDFSPNGEIKDLNLVAPEFKLHNTSKAVTTLNQAFNRTFWLYFGGSWEGYDPTYAPFGPLSAEQSDIITNSDWMYPLADDPELLINQIDKVLTYGQMSDETRQYLRDAIAEIDWPWDLEGQQRFRTSMTLFLTQFSPDYTILK